MVKNEIKSSFDSANVLKGGVPCDSYISPHNVVQRKEACYLTNARPKMPVKSLNFTINYSEQEQNVKMERADLRDSRCVHCFDKDVYILILQACLKAFFCYTIKKFSYYSEPFRLASLFHCVR